LADYGVLDINSCCLKYRTASHTQAAIPTFNVRKDRPMVYSSWHVRCPAAIANQMYWHMLPWRVWHAKSAEDHSLTR